MKVRMISAFVVAALLCLAAAASSIASEPEDLKDTPGSSKNKSVVETDPKTIAKLIDDINAAVRANKQRMLSIITINTDVAASTLEQEKARTGLSFGEIYVAHSLSLATKKKFSAIVALKKSGQTWAQIAKSHKVTLKGSSELIREMQKQ